MNSTKKNILRLLSQNEFGVKPLEGNILMALNDNYNIQPAEAKVALSEMLRSNLISVDSMTGRYSLTQKGYNKACKEDDSDFDLTPVDEDRPAIKTKTSLRKTIETLGIIIGIIASLFTIYFLLFDHKFF